MLTFLVTALAATAADAGSNALSCGAIQKLQPATYAQSSAHNYLPYMTATPEAKAVLAADQNFAGEYLKEAQKACGSSEQANQAAKKLSDSLSASAAQITQCKSYLTVGKGLAKAELALKPSIAKLNLFLTQFPVRAAKAAQKNQDGLKQLQQKNPGTVNASQLTQEAGKFFLGNIPGYSDGLNLNLYQSLWQQRNQACAAMKKMMDSEVEMRGRYTACNPKVGGTPYSPSSCYQSLDSGDYDPDQFAHVPSNKRLETVWTTSTATSMEIMTITTTAWTTTTNSGTETWFDDATPGCAFVPPQNYYDLCGSIH